MKKSILSVLLLSVLGYSAVIQKCSTSITKTAPNIRFENDDVKGITKDLQTGLIWNRCIVGKTWNSTLKTCEGNNSKLSWQLALKKAKEFNEASSSLNKTGIKKWRLPNIKELMSIKENACISPSLNSSVFPNLLDDPDYESQNYIWTSTVREINKKVYAYIPNSNEVNLYTIDKEFGVMLVSDSPSN